MGKSRKGGAGGEGSSKKKSTRNTRNARRGSTAEDEYDSDESLRSFASFASMNSIRSGAGAFERMNSCNTNHEDSDYYDDEGGGGGGIKSKFELDFNDALDMLDSSRALERSNGFESIINCCKKHFVPHLIERNHETLIERGLRSLKSGKKKEQLAAVKMIGLAGFQLAGDFSDSHEGEMLFESVEGLFVQRLVDGSGEISAQVRCEIAEVLSSFAFFFLDDSERIQRLMHRFEYFFQPKTAAIIDPELVEAAIEAWTLLLTKLPLTFTQQHFYKYVIMFYILLKEDSDVDLIVRIQAGEAIALLYEFMGELEDPPEEYEYHTEEKKRKRKNSEDSLLSNNNNNNNNKKKKSSTNEDDEDDDEFADETPTSDNIAQLIEAQLEMFCNESSKSKSKKDRRHQRASFRDVLRAVQEGYAPTESMKLNAHEPEVVCTTWEAIIHLQAFRDFLGTGLKVHLEKNMKLRDIFDLGRVVDQEEGKMAMASMSKFAKMKRFNNISKAQKQGVKKERDLRSKQKAAHILEED
eukprot:Nk52_evm3s159 gene=Nk52_evmTU3s159